MRKNQSRQQNQPRRAVSRRRPPVKATRKSPMALSLIGGLGVGAALMYLMDPTSGIRRRHLLSDAASSAAGYAADHVGDSLRHVAHHAQDAWEKAAHYGQQLAEPAISNAKEATHRLADSMADARGWIGRPARPTTAQHVGHTLGTAGLLAFGAAVMYFFDPDRGADRRAGVTDCAHSALTETGNFFRTAGNTLADRATGVGREARAWLGNGEDESMGDTSEAAGLPSSMPAVPTEGSA